MSSIILSQPGVAHPSAIVGAKAFYWSNAPGIPTPTTANQAAWWTSRLGVTKDGSDLVTTVDDQSGNGRTLGYVGGFGKPLWQANQFNGHPAILFRNDLAPNFNYLAAAFALVQPFTVYLMTQIVTRGALDFLFDGVTATTRLGTQGVAPTMRVNAGVNLDNATGTDGQLQIHTVVFNGASSSYQINNLTAAAGDAGANNAGGITINSDFTLGAFWANQNWLEMLVYSDAQSAGNQAQNKAFLAYIGGLTI